MPARFKLGRLEVDTQTQEVWVDAARIELTAREYAVLEYLCRKEGTVISRQELSEHVWDDRYDPNSNVIDVYINRLRRKLDDQGTSFIRTRRGAGYQLVARSGIAP
jgi:two-component system copper resistance phosphate regulon response regulator CusR